MLQLSEYELTVATDIVDPLTLPITWKDIGGLRETIDEIKVWMNIKSAQIRILTSNKYSPVPSLPVLLILWNCSPSQTTAIVTSRYVFEVQFGHCKVVRVFRTKHVFLTIESNSL